tara:strand:+ start:103 stop:471 length:369 start_codon:yes stop_codon:yes gene_type:complete
MKTYKNLSSEIKALNAQTDAITAKIDKEEISKEFKIKKMSTAYHKINASNLPLFKKRNALNSTWLYKLHISEGRLTMHKMAISANSVEVYSLSTESIFEEGLEKSTEKEWHNGICKLLKIID